MEMTKGVLEQIMARQADRVAKESEKRMKHFVAVSLRKLDKQTQKRMARQEQKSDERMDKRFSVWAKESDERMQRYIGGLIEDFDHKIDTVMEYVKEIPDMKAKLDVTLEKDVEMAVDVEIIKNAVKDR